VKSSFLNGNVSSQNYQLALIRRFDFSSKLSRMSVIVKNFSDNTFRAYVKGAPERLKELCDPSSIPNNYEEILEIYT
jgi:cation-transporting P-type ATPase 13A2